MCTVSFIPVKDHIYITSNRDEKLVRKKAIPPKKYNIGNTILIFPKDGEAGGTWIALRENGDASVLLNGGFKKHIPTLSYDRSRGLVFLEVISESMHAAHFLRMNLQKIEPFTLVMFENNNLYECRWTGNKKYCRQLLKSKPHIWSSVTLYDEKVISKRESWFTEWLKNSPCPIQEDILRFHLFGGESDMYNDFRMNRDNQVLTVSVTGIDINSKIATMKYFDLIDTSMQETKFDFHPAHVV